MLGKIDSSVLSGTLTSWLPAVPKSDSSVAVETLMSELPALPRSVSRWLVERVMSELPEVPRRFSRVVSACLVRLSSGVQLAEREKPGESSGR